VESKKKMAQGYSDLKAALEKGKGSVEESFQRFETASQAFLKETRKVPVDAARHFLDQVRQLGQVIEQGNRDAINEQMGVLKGLKKSCHDQFK
jgi:formiminotetrahydrofolate cyclodeaminase